MKRIFTILISIVLLLSVHNTTYALSEKDERQMIQNIMNDMTVKEKIGQLVMPDTHDDYTSLPDERTKALIQEYHAGSFIIYGHYDGEHTANYTNQLQTWANETEQQIPLFISADLEYGAVQHVTNATVFPRLMGIAATRDTEAAKKVASITAKEARAVGYHWNYTPSVDVNVNPLNPVIGVRAFSESVDLVADMAIATIEGHQENGVLATAKHFPGHGNTSIDTHYGIDSVDYDRQTLDDIHLAPFKVAIEAGVDSIMTSHIIVEAIDPDLPATLSKKVLTDLLRDELNFDGLIITDAMDMGAMVNHYGRGDAAKMTILAGADVIIAKGTYEEQIATFEGLYDAYDTGELTLERIDASVKRILTYKLKYNLFDDRFVDVEKAKAIVLTEEHKQFAEEVAQQSITLLKNDDVLPFDAEAEQTTLVVGPTIYNERYYIEDIAQYVENVVVGNVEHMIVSDEPTNGDIKKVIKKAEDVDRVIVATFSASELPHGQAELVKALANINKSVVAVSLGLPYDIAQYPEVDAYLATYAIERWGSPVPTAWNAAIDVIFGATPGGQLPVTIENYYDIDASITYDTEHESRQNVEAKDNDEQNTKDEADELHDGTVDESEDKKSSVLPYIIIASLLIAFIAVFTLAVKNKKDNT